MTRSVTFLWLLVALAAGLPPTALAAETYPDSTIGDSWRLANGLEVRIRNVPGAGATSITLAYRAGELTDTKGHEGLAALLAELQFTSPAGSAPERSRAELESLRPSGWGLAVHDHLVLMTENAAPDQFPGVLRQVAQRMRGVQVTDSSLAHALRTVRRDLAERRFGSIAAALHERLRAVATGVDDAALLKIASGAGLAGIDVARAQALLGQRYVPANAALAIVGDFHDLDLRAVVEHEFADIPGGTATSAVTDTTHAALAPARRVSVLADLSAPVGAVGVFAPSLDDTLHPAFFLATLMAGGMWGSTLGEVQPPLESYFHFSVLDEPDLIHFNAVPPATCVDPGDISKRWLQVMEDFRGMAVQAPVIDLVRGNVDWLLGGPMPKPLIQQAHRDPSVVATVSIGLATRACWRGDAFWDLYRHRFETTRLGPTIFMGWMMAPEHEALLLLTPRR